jgi:hypothetical protein
MNDKILKRIDAKLDIIIGLLHDGILAGDELALLAETDEIVRKGAYQTLEKL